MMNKDGTKKLKLNIFLNLMLFLFFFSISLNPLVNYILKFSSLHLLFIAVIFVTSMGILIFRGKLIKNTIFLTIIIYVLTVIVGILLGLARQSITGQEIFQFLSYRIIYPITFLFYLSLFNKIEKLNKLGILFLVVINFNAILISIVGIIETLNPSLVHNLYGSSLTNHLTLILNNEFSNRLVSLSGNPINLGFYMTIGISSSLILILMNFKKRKFITFFEVITIPIMLYVMFYTYSRSAIMLTAVIVVTIFLFVFRNINLYYKLLMIFFAFLLYMGVNSYLLEIDASITTRIDTITLNSYFENTRFLRAYEGFANGTNAFEFFFGHGIKSMNSSGAYVFELGYASLLYESGIIGFIAVIFSFFKGIKSGVYVFSRENNLNAYLDVFYLSIIISGIVGLFFQDIYMQLPYSALLWFSTLYLIFKENLLRYSEKQIQGKNNSPYFKY